MAKSIDQKLKLLYLQKILFENTDENNGLTCAEIIEKLAGYGISVERKTFYNDIEALRGFGVDIETSKDKTVKYFIGERLFEAPELKLLVDAVQASRFITAKKSEKLIKKIESLAGKNESQKLQRQVFVTNRIKNINERIYYNVDGIHEAISGNFNIRFQYCDWNEKKERVPRHNGKYYVVSPWNLVWDAENYYLIAYNSEYDEIRHYRVDRMDNLSVCKEKRTGEEKFKGLDLAEYMQKTFGMFGGDAKLVTLRCSNKMAGIMIDRFGENVLLRPVGDKEHFDITIEVSVSKQFYGWIFGLEPDVKIISPEFAISEYVDAASEILKKYKR